MSPVTRPLTVIVAVWPPIFPESPESNGMKDTAIGMLAIVLSNEAIIHAAMVWPPSVSKSQGSLARTAKVTFPFINSSDGKASLIPEPW